MEWNGIFVLNVLDALVAVCNHLDMVTEESWS